MTIDEAIRARLDRFNRLWKKAVGYTFEEERAVLDKIYEKESLKWMETAEPLYKKYGFWNYEDLWDYLMRHGLYEDDDEYRSIPSELLDLFHSKPMAKPSLYEYEMEVIKEARNIVEFVEKKSAENGIGMEEQWDRYIETARNKGYDTYDFVYKVLKPDGYDKWNDGHSGNSGTKSVLFAECLIKHPDMFPYIHGALAEMVGDAGYYDNREDAKEYLRSIKEDMGNRDDQED